MWEYKFWGKRLDNGEWVYGDLANIALSSLGLAIVTGCDEGFAEDTVLCIITIKTMQHPYFSNAEPYAIIENEYHIVDPVTVGQFIGQRDANSVEVYEGNIVKSDDSNWGYGGDYDKKHDGYLYTAVPSIDKLLSGECDGLFKNYQWYKSCEVVGNIHDNPNLLEVAE